MSSFGVTLSGSQNWVLSPGLQSRYCPSRTRCLVFAGKPSGSPDRKFYPRLHTFLSLSYQHPCLGQASSAPGRKALPLRGAWRALGSDFLALALYHTSSFKSWSPDPIPVSGLPVQRNCWSAAWRDTGCSWYLQQGKPGTDVCMCGLLHLTHGPVLLVVESHCKLQWPLWAVWWFTHQPPSCGRR